MKISFEPTYKELKQPRLEAKYVRVSRFEPTYKELKLSCCNFARQSGHMF